MKYEPLMNRVFRGQMALPQETAAFLLRDRGISEPYKVIALAHEEGVLSLDDGGVCVYRGRRW